MDPTIPGGPTGETRRASGAPSEEAGLPEQAQLLWHELRGLAHDRLRLAALETQQAGESLVVMITAGVILGGLLLSIWLGLLAVAVFELTSRGVMGLGSALLLTVALNLAVALLLWGEIRRRGRHLRFPANTRVLKPEPSPLSERENAR
jgi:hypothetical protein